MNDNELSRHGSSGPSPWVERFLGDSAAEGAVLDVACGGGRHLRSALARGWSACGIDRDLTGVADLAGQPRVELIRADLEGGAPFPARGRSFAVVIVTNYLWRPILADIVAAVASDGLLVYETFAAGNERFGRPSNPAFLLRPGELIEAMRDRLVCVGYEHVRLTGPDRIVQRIAAVGRDHPWLAEPPLSR